MHVILSSLLVLLAASSVSTREGTAAGETVDLRGRAVCVSAPGAEESCQDASRRFALRSADGALHPFAPTDELAGMFADQHVRERDLLVRARPTPAGLETIKVYAVQAGKLHDLDYYCEVCNIVAYAPGPCPCCRQPLVLRVTPLP